ncbi:WESB_1763 family membrane protein, partial [Brachyspira murdochii]|uniref:WESB_1763 family membrane protein n=1 Tax=Brachyspira murdochii TaxID=84378 RepID=UPI0028006FFA
TLMILIPMILSKTITEAERGIYIFILLSLLSSNINYLIISANKIIDTDSFHYISTYISNYMSKLSSFSFLVLMIYYILIFIKEVIMKNINISFMFAVIAIILSIAAIFLFWKQFFLNHNIIFQCFRNCNVSSFCCLYGDYDYVFHNFIHIIYDFNSIKRILS